MPTRDWSYGRRRVVQAEKRGVTHAEPDLADRRPRSPGLVLDLGGGERQAQGQLVVLILAEHDRAVRHHGVGAAKVIFTAPAGLPTTGIARQ